MNELWYIHNGILFSNKNKPIHVILLADIVEGKKPDTKEYLTYIDI